jgi:hypothetical protein
MQTALEEATMSIDGGIHSSQLIRAADFPYVLSARQAALAYQKLLVDMHAIVQEQIAQACERASRQGVQYAVQQVIGRYGQVHEQLQNATNAVAHSMVNDLADALQVVLTDEQRAQILGRVVLRELSGEPVPKLAIRVPLALEAALQRWITENMPAALADRVRLFTSDMLPSGHMVIRADDTVSEHTLEELTRDACMNAAKSAVPNFHLAQMFKED